jgi:hypothetical protein
MHNSKVILLGSTQKYNSSEPSVYAPIGTQQALEIIFILKDEKREA